MSDNSSVSIYTLDVTPEIATEWLTKNYRNRPLAEARVVRHAYAMSNGLWNFDGAPIRRTDDGRLLDGQHRLSAVVRSGVPQRFVIMDGIDPLTQSTMDTGAKRSLADALTMNGERNGKDQAAIVNAAYRWDILDLRAATVFGGRGPYAGGNVQMSELLDMQDMYREVFEEALSWSDRIRKVLFVPGRMIGLLAWAILQIDQTDAVRFLTGLWEGTELEKGSPILALRNYYIGVKGESTSTDVWKQFQMGVRAWNLYRQHQKITILRLPNQAIEPR